MGAGEQVRAEDGVAEVGRGLRQIQTAWISGTGTPKEMQGQDNPAEHNPPPPGWAQAQKEPGLTTAPAHHLLPCPNGAQDGLLQPRLHVQRLLEGEAVDALEGLLPLGEPRIRFRGRWGLPSS